MQAVSIVGAPVGRLFFSGQPVACSAPSHHTQKIISNLYQEKLKALKKVVTGVGVYLFTTSCYQSKHTIYTTRFLTLCILFVVS